MATDFVTSKGYIFEVSTDGLDYSEVGGILSISEDITVNEIEGSAIKDDWGVYKPGRKSGTLSADMRYIADDEGQAILINAKFDGTEIHVKWAPATGTTTHTAKAFVVSMPPSIEDEAPIDYSVTLRITGEVEEVPAV
ncbi:MAG: hypothetical protein PHN69_03820 [Candidatus Pacebacteria bacterium]|nr:hypothetical protein [Candidatus Paceibacterota bacterium]